MNHCECEMATLTADEGSQGTAEETELLQLLDDDCDIDEELRIEI